VSNIAARSNKGIKALIQWLALREEHGRPFPSSLEQLQCDLDHSALLLRLLEGKEPFPEPPPRAHSYPNYGLLENGWHDPLEVNEYDKGSSLAKDEGGPVIVIDQTIWKLIAKVGDEEWIVTYEVPDTKKLAELARKANMMLADYLKKTGRNDIPMRFASGKWRVRRDGIREDVDPSSSLSKKWRLEKIP
jgi:hypothetical protein